MKRTIVIGLDGADWYFINKGIRYGLLSNFGNVIEKGASGTLISLPPLTAPAWSSITTGKRIKNHGIMGFSWITYDYKLKLISAKDKKAKDFWEFIDRSIIINVPITYPVKPINGIIIGGMLSPSLSPYSVYPSKEIDLLRKMGYVIEPEPTPKSIINSLITRIEVTKYYYKKYRWNLLFVVFREFDIMQHNFWDKAFTLYEIIDEFIGWLLDNIDSHTNLFIISDHGFTKINKVFIIENWLKENGYLKVFASGHNYLGKLYPYLIMIKRVFDRYNITSLSVIKKITKLLLSREKHRVWKRPIDYYSSSILYGLWCELFVNTKGRFQHGFIDNINTLKLISKIKKELLKYTHGDKYVIGYLKTRFDIGAPYSVKIPDLIYYVNSEAGFSGVPSVEFTDRPVISATKVKKEGEHTKNAIFLAYGPNIKKGVKLNNKRRLIDLVPTIFTILNINNLHKFDGEPMYEILR